MSELNQEAQHPIKRPSLILKIAIVVSGLLVGSVLGVIAAFSLNLIEISC